MSLKYELAQLERQNKDNPKKEEVLLSACERYMPEEKQSALTYIFVVNWIDETWREFAQEHSLNVEAFKQWVQENNGAAKVLMGW